MSGTFREVDESQGKHRKALLGIGVLLCLGLGVSLAFVGESAAVDAEGDGLTASSLKDAPLAAPGQVPQGLAEALTQSSPDVEISAGPTGTAHYSEATFAFGSDTGVAFECSLDGGTFEPCTSPHSYSGLQNGTHVFSVRITSGGGSAIPAQRSWNVENTLPCTDSEEPVNFEVYSLGDSVAGLDATSVSRHCAELQPEATVRPNFVSYIYGTCPELDNGATPMCAPPLEIQTWPACERSLADYELAPGTPYPYEALGDLKGVPAYSFDQGTRIELYAGNVTIVIFAGDPALAQQAVASIQPEPTAQPPAEPTSAAAGAELPEPESGAISGELSCA